jgi:hypothetical protein
MQYDYSSWLENARQHLTTLQQQKDQLRAQQAALALQEQEIDRQISGMAHTVSGLASLVPEPPPDFSLSSVLELIGKVIVDVGLTDRIRTVLQAHPQGLSAVELRGALQASGFYLGDYANALSTIYTTLRRLVEAGKVEEITTPDAKRFQWRTAANALALDAARNLPVGARHRRKAIGSLSDHRKSAQPSGATQRKEEP